MVPMSTFATLFRRQRRPARPQGDQRRLALEPCEERILLSAAPVGKDDTFVLGSAAPVTSFGTVLANDRDPNGKPMSSLLESSTARGDLSLGPDGTFAYAPNSSFHGIDSFSYRATNGSAGSDVVTTYLISQQANTVQKLYEQVLGRAPERGGWDFWTDRISAGTASLGTIASGIFESNERLNPIVARMYHDYLFREADESGLGYWRDLVWKRDGGPDNVIAGIVSSPEFFQSAGGTNPGWVTEMYRRLLHREPDQGGQVFWTNQLNTGAMDRPSVVHGFVGSEENFHNLVKGWYLQYLGRPATWIEEDNFVGRLKSGDSQRSIQIQLLDSREYIATMLAPEPGVAVPADISGFGVTDDDGIVRLQAGGRPFSFQLFDEQTKEPLREYAAALVLDPETRGLGVLTLVDIRGALPTKVVVVVDGGASANVQPQSAVGLRNAQALSVVGPGTAASDLPIPISISKVEDGVIKVVVKSIFEQPVFEKVSTALKLKDLALLGLKAATGLGVVKVDLGEVHTVHMTSDDAMAKIRYDLGAGFLTTALLFRATGGQLGVGAFGVTVDLAKFAIDSATVLACAREAPPGAENVSVTTVPGLGAKLYACRDDVEPPGTELVSVHVPTPAEMTTGSLELLSQANLGKGYFAPVEPGGNFNLHVPPGRYRAIVRSPSFDPKTTDVNVPQGGLQLVLSLDPGVTKRVTIENHHPDLMRLNTATEYNILLATARGGFGPYTFTLDSGTGFQPLGMTLVTEGNNLYLRGTPSEGSANPFVRKFGVCVKDLAGASDCVDTPFSYTVSPPSIIVNPTAGLVTTESGGSASLTVSLAIRPESNVTIGLSSSNTGEGTVAPSSLVFTPANWNAPQTVTVTGVDDMNADGNAAYTVVIARAVSADPAYNGQKALDVNVVNQEEVTGPTADTTGTWQGPFSESNPIQTISGTMTVVVRAFPLYTTVVTGSITLNSNTESMTGTVKGTRFVFDVPPPPGFFRDQFVGTVIGNTMKGKIQIADTSGGTTNGDFTLTKIG